MLFNVSEMDKEALIKAARELEEATNLLKKEIAEREKNNNIAYNEQITKSKIGQFAIKLHKKRCMWNHTDGCGWYYEMIGNTDNWDGDSHRRWKNTATQVLNRLSNGVTVTEENYFDVMDSLFKV